MKNIFKFIFFIFTVAPITSIAHSFYEKEHTFTLKSFLEQDKNNGLIKCNISNSWQEEALSVGKFYSGVWTGDTFSGNHCRKMGINGNSLKVSIASLKGGFDTSLNVKSIDLYKKYITVDEILNRHDENLNIRAKFSKVVNGDKNTYRWWIGPKVGVRPCRSSSECPSIWNVGWRENYVIENSDLTPDEYHTKLTNKRRNGKYLGEQYHNTSKYRYYVKDHRKWKQYWVVRQDYRNGGTVNMTTVMKNWRQYGMKNGFIHSLRYNIETSGTLEGAFKIDDFNVFNVAE